jgi:magnesium-transporting ATPase (P-type)
MLVIMITSGMPDMGLGFEAANPDIMSRPPQSLKRGVFTLEVMVDMLVYGLWIAALCLGAFSSSCSVLAMETLGRTVTTPTLRTVILYSEPAQPVSRV